MKNLIKEINKLQYEIFIEHYFRGKKFDGYMSYEDIYNILTEANRNNEIDDEEYYRKLYELIMLGEAEFTLDLDNSQGGDDSITYYCKVKGE